MFPTNATAWLWYIAAGVAIGVIGNAVWEVAFRRFLPFLGRVILRIATMGLHSSRDRIYRDMATRLPDRPAFLLLFVLVLSLNGLAGYTSQGYFRIVSGEAARQEAELDRMKNEIAAFEEETKRITEEAAGMSPDELASLLDESKSSSENFKKTYTEGVAKLRDNLEQLALSLMLMAIGSVLFCLYKLARFWYIAVATAHFDQCLVICNPYIPEVDHRKLMARFASVSGLKDFADLMATLKTIAEENSVPLPVFIIL